MFAAVENYCRAHDLFDCEFSHETRVLDVAPTVVEDLDAPTVTPAELDAARARMGSALVTFVVSDAGAQVNLIGRMSDDPTTFYGRTDRTGALCLVRVTSHTWQAKPRVRVTMGQDHGYADGRVTFDGATFGGHGWRDALANVGYVLAF
jgi:hypothetical protein